MPSPQPAAAASPTPAPKGRLVRTVKVAAGPREGGKYPGFGAIQRYFISNQPQEFDVSEEEYAELTSSPAKDFLMVEVLDEEPEAPAKKQ